MSIRTLTAVLEGLSPYSQSRHHSAPFLEGENHEAHNRRTWREHAHYDPKTREVFAPASSLKWAIAKAAARLQLKKKGHSTWTQDILAGVIVPANIQLLIHGDPDEAGKSKLRPVTLDDLSEEEIYANLDGKRGGKSRGPRWYPMIPRAWAGTAQIIIADETIPEDIIERCLEHAGNVVGIGRFRPENGGFFGRFSVKSMKWSGIGKQMAA
jgi:hypothetical protein